MPLTSKIASGHIWYLLKLNQSICHIQLEQEVIYDNQIFFHIQFTPDVLFIQKIFQKSL